MRGGMSFNENIKIINKNLPDLKTYDLFISHAWRYNEEYYKLVNMLNRASNFKWRNYSVPTHDPLVDPNSEIGRDKLIQMLDNQIRPVNCVLILAGMYANYSYWINKEIEIAKKYNKPILGIKPWGQERVPKVVEDSAKWMQGWDTNAIVNSIRLWSI